MTTCHSPVNYSTLSMQLSALFDILDCYSQEQWRFFFSFYFSKHPASAAEHPSKLFSQYSNGIAWLHANVLWDKRHVQDCRKRWKTIWKGCKVIMWRWVKHRASSFFSFLFSFMKCFWNICYSKYNCQHVSWKDMICPNAFFLSTICHMHSFFQSLRIWAHKQS